MNARTEPAARNRVDIGSLLLEGRAFIALIVLIIIFALLSDSYLSIPNLITMTKHVAVNAVLALGMLFVILKGGIDLSIGSTVGLSGVVAGILLTGVPLDFTDITAYPSVAAIVVISIAVGALVGLTNGVLVTKFNVAPFIATLGMMYVARGAALLLSNGTTNSKLDGDPALGNTGFGELGRGRFLEIPTHIWIMVVFAIVAFIVLKFTPFGRWIYAIGGNERAAELSGIPVKKVKVWVYVISGMCAAVAGLLIASELGAAAPQTGEAFELNAIAAVVIGGAALSGGRGNVRGVLLGAFVIGFLSDGLVIVGVSTFWQMLIKGAVIVLAVMLDQAQQRFKRSKSLAQISAPGAPGAPTSRQLLTPAASTEK